MLDGEGLQPPSDMETLARILNRSASLVHARGCGVFFWDKDRNVLTAMWPFVGLDHSQVKGLDFPVSGTALGSCVLQDRAVLMDRDGQPQVDREMIHRLSLRNAVAVPLALERRDENNEITDRTVMGAFVAFDRYYDRGFDLEDARLLSMMARQASAVLVTSQLYWKEIDRTKRTTATFQSTSVGLMAVSPNGTVTQVNAAAARAALPPDSREGGWFGRSYKELIKNQEITEIIEDALYGNPLDKPRELSLPVSNGTDGLEERIYRVQIDPIRSEDNQSMGWVIAFEDVSDIRQAERMMAVFVDMVSHELRTPLTSIRGFGATLLQAGEGTFPWETQAEFLQIMDTEAERLGGMIDDLLNIARIQNGRGMQFTFVVTRVRRLVDHVVRLLCQSSFMKGNHDIVVDVPDDLPDILADDAKLQQILNNLISNALKYSPNGGEVRVSAQREDRAHSPGIRITVSDQGLGIPPEALPKMFGQFFRVEGGGHSTIKGTGLGLWLTRHMVEGHGGQIWVESEYGHGCRFHVWLPLDPNALAS